MSLILALYASFHPIGRPHIFLWVLDKNYQISLRLHLLHAKAADIAPRHEPRPDRARIVDKALRIERQATLQIADDPVRWRASALKGILWMYSMRHYKIYCDA